LQEEKAGEQNEEQDEESDVGGEESRLEVLPCRECGEIRVIVEDPNQAPDREVQEYWCPLGGVNDGCVPFHEVFDGQARYEKHGELDEHGASVVLFADAITVRPWDLRPPSAKTLADRGTCNGNMHPQLVHSQFRAPRSQPALSLPKRPRTRKRRDYGGQCE